VITCALAALGLALLAPPALAQDLQPGVQTSGAAAPAPGPAGAANASSGGASAVNRSQAASPPAPGSAPGGGPAPAAGPPAAAGPAPAPRAAPGGTPAATSAAPKGGKASDRLQLDTTQISGNRELPKVMYVVPWRKADPGDFAGRPLNSLLDEALTPVDRDVFRRQNRYYAALQGDPGPVKSQPGATADPSASPSAKDEK
jgi:hypothetical protein